MHVDYDKEISCIVSHRQLQDVTLKKELTDKTDPKWSLTISIGKNNGIAEVDQIGNSVKNNLFDILCLMLGIQVKNVRLVAHGLTPRPGEGGQMHLIMPAPSLNATLSGNGLPLSGQGIQEIQDAMKRCPTAEDPLLGIFRHALNIEDHVHEFLMLYFILYDIHETQAAVDRFILTVEPSTPQSCNKKMKTKETLYTKLRNQLAHKTAVPLEETRAEIANNLDNFRRIVQRALKATL